MFDLSFGNSRCVRSAFLRNNCMAVFSYETLSNFDYPKEEGDPELIEITRKIIERQVGKKYKHILLTNGATGALAITLRMYNQKGFSTCITRHAPYYPRYSYIIDAANLGHADEASKQLTGDTMILLDMPSNPLGLTTEIIKTKEIPVVLDGVYLNNVYTDGKVKLVPHEVLVGSYSKLLGLNGIRVGWIAVDDDLIYDRLKRLVIAEYSGIDRAGTELLRRWLPSIDWDSFESTARRSLDYNREEWSRLEKYFQGAPVIKYGMFAYQPIDKKCNELLQKSGIIWTTGSSMGADDSFGRFNLGQDEETIKNAVKTIIKVDTIR